MTDPIPAPIPVTSQDSADAAAATSAGRAAAMPDAITIGGRKIGFREFVGLIASGMAMMALGIDTMLPALPAIGKGLGLVDPNARQWVISAYVLGFGVCQIIYGPLSDRFGQRKFILAGTAGYAVFNLAATLTSSFRTMILVRVLQGASVAAARVIGVSVVRDCYGGRQMARVMSIVTIVFMGVPLIAPSLGQLILLFAPWRGVFAVLSVIGAVILVWAGLRLPETLHPEYRRAIDVKSILAAVRKTLSTRQACTATCWR